MLPSACGLGQHFQDRANNIYITYITYIYYAARQQSETCDVYIAMCTCTGYQAAYFVIAELQPPEGPPNGAPHPYGKQKETHELIFSWLAVLLVGAYARRRSRAIWHVFTRLNLLANNIAISTSNMLYTFFTGS